MESASPGGPDQARDVSWNVPDLTLGMGKACQELKGVRVSGSENRISAGPVSMSFCTSLDSFADLARRPNRGDERTEISSWTKLFRDGGSAPPRSRRGHGQFIGNDQIGWGKKAGNHEPLSLPPLNW
jgi:hypothetical protein